MKKINIGFLAHVDAGKTTLTERILFKTGTVRHMGSVDDGTAYTDSLDIEKRRGITVSVGTAVASHSDCKINIIDTPGHTDFSSQVERCICALDGAVIIISSPQGVTGYTKQLYNAVKRNRKPVIFFINKIDSIGSRVEEVFDEIKKIAPSAVLLNKPSREGDREADIKSEDAMLQIADISDEALSLYLEDSLDPCKANEILYGLTSECKACPVLCGSAAYDIGITELMETVKNAFPDAVSGDEEQLSGYIYKIEHDKAFGRVAYTRIFSGGIKTRDSVTLSDGMTYKITRIRRQNGAGYADCENACEGDVVLLYGLTSAKAGYRIGKEQNLHLAEIQKPLLKISVKPAKEGSEGILKLRIALLELDAEEPSFDCYYSEETGEFVLSIMGDIQIEVLKDLLSARFGIDAVIKPVSILYKETPSQIGYGFDAYTMPKPCWAVVDFMIEPLPSGSGVEFESRVPARKIAYKYQEHVKVAVKRALAQGRFGFEVTDCKVTLIDGEDHPMHTHPLDFFVATPMAMMKGYESAKTVLLEPYMKYEIVSPEECCGRIMTEIINMRGSVTDRENDMVNVILRGEYPLAEFLSFPSLLASVTKGRGILQSEFSCYRKAPQGTVARLPYKGINPLDRSKFILWARNALTGENSL